MAHNSITPKDEDRYDEGDALDVPFQVKDEHSDTVIDLTGHTVEFRLKESLTDADTDALVTKTGTEGDTPTDVTFTDATNGNVEVHIESGTDTTDGDTEGVLTDADGNRAESEIFEWHFRVIDSNGNRVTSEVGDWEIFAS